MNLNAKNRSTAKIQFYGPVVYWTGTLHPGIMTSLLVRGYTDTDMIIDKPVLQILYDILFDIITEMI